MAAPGKRMLLPFLSVFALAVFSLTYTGACQAGWFDDVRLTNDPDASLTAASNARNIAMDDSGQLHVVWMDYRGGLPAIYYKHFDGVGWTETVRLTPDDTVSAYPAVTMDALGHFHVVWVDYRDGLSGIFHKRFDGVSWTEDERLTPVDTISTYPAIAADNLGNIHLVWSDYRDGNSEVYYTRYDGVSWSTAERLTDEQASSFNPSIATGDSGRLYVVWYDNRDYNWEIYCKSFDGSSWGPDTRLTDDPAVSQSPSVTTDPSGRVHVAWEDSRDGNFEIYYKVFDGGWSLDQRLTTDPGTSESTCLASDDLGNLHIVWSDNRTGASEIYYRRFDGSAWSAELRLTNASGASEKPSAIADSAGISHIVWQDRRDGNFEIYYKSTGPDLPPAPSLVSIQPDSAYWYSVGEVVDLAGENFEPGAGVRLQLVGEDDIIAYDVDVVSSTQITCRLDLAGAQPASWDVVVENLDAQMDTLAGAFRVIENPKPEIASIDPDSGYQYERVRVVDLAGNHFHPGTEVWMGRVGSADILAEDVRIVSLDLITCDFHLWEADTGDWDVMVRAPDGKMDTLEAGFRVLALPAPVITSIEPGQWVRDDVVNLRIEGDYLVDSIRVRLERFDESPRTATNVVVESIRAITCDLDLAAATDTIWDITVYNPNGQYFWQPHALRVLPGPWGDEVRLTTAEWLSYTSRVNARCIATDAQGNVHVVWTDMRNWATHDCSGDIYYKKYDGVDWGPDVELAGASIHSEDPAIAIDGYGNVHVVFDEGPDGSSNIFYMRYDGAWSPKEQITFTAGSTAYPSVAAAGDTVHVVWQDMRSDSAEVYYKWYDGTDWRVGERLTWDGGVSYNPAVAVDAQGNVHVAWYNYENFNHVIYHRMFDGAIWTPKEAISEKHVTGGPSIAADADGNVYAAWQARPEAGMLTEIYLTRFTGAIWEPPERLTYSDATSQHPSVAVGCDGAVHVVYVDDRKGNLEVYYRRFDGLAWESERGLTASGDDCRRPSAATDSEGNLHIVWGDDRHSIPTFDNSEIYYRMRTPEETAAIRDTLGSDRYGIVTGTIAVSPNPCFRAVRVEFRLGTSSQATIAVYDVAGRSVWARDLGVMDAGHHRVFWPGYDRYHRPVAPGIYIIRIETPDRHLSVKALIVR